MVAHIEVEVVGAFGLDDSADLLAELVRETGFDWHQEQVPEGRHLSGGVAEFLLAAALSGAAGKAGEFAYDKGAELVRAVVARWSARYLDPPEVRVEVVGTPGAPDAEQGAPAAGGAAGVPAPGPSPTAAADHPRGA